MFSEQQLKKISIIVPVYNEEKNIPLLCDRLRRVFNEHSTQYEIIFVDDGSTDGSATILQKLSGADSQVKVIEFSRNFGKELATTAGIHACTGDACIMIDADLQHPPELIPEFLSKWRNGAEVVVGVRTKNSGEGIIRSAGSYFFYKLINAIADTKITPHATDYRLLDRVVIDEFNKFPETNRLTRGLIDWLGFRRDYVHFEADSRFDGKPRYGFTGLVRLSLHSIVSMSMLPLRLAGYLGGFIVIVAGVSGLAILVGKYFFNNAVLSSFSGPAQLAILILFLVGVILCCLGLIALYIANIHNEAMNRPLYVVRKKINLPSE